MTSSLYKKGMVFVVIGLFIGAGIISIFNEKPGKISIPSTVKANYSNFDFKSKEENKNKFLGSNDPLPDTAQVDIIVSDEPDPFNPFIENSTITITYNGTIPGLVNLTMGEINRTWDLGQMHQGDNTSVIWDGKNDIGYYVPPGLYNYTSTAVQWNEPLFPGEFGFIDTENGTINVTYPLDYVHVDDDYNASTPGWGYDHFDVIQDGIDAVAENGTVYVYNGTYYENVIVNKSLHLIGENKNTTIIDGNGNGDAIIITANKVNISCFTIQNGYAGIWLENSISSSIIKNVIKSNTPGLYIEYSDNITISGNTIKQNYGAEMVVSHCNNNTIAHNIIYKSAETGLYISGSNNNQIHNNNFHNNGEIELFNLNGNNNYIYHNNFYYSHDNAIFDYGTNYYDIGYPFGGNYWSCYPGTDNYSGPNQDIPGADNIGDIPYLIDDGPNLDNYPFINENGWLIDNSPVANFTYQPEKPSVGTEIIFNASNSYDPNGYIISYEWNFGDVKWENKTPMPTDRRGLTAECVNGKIYAIGGRPAGTTGPDDVATTEMYNPINDTWAVKSSMNKRRSCLASAVVDDKIYAIGGFLNGHLSTVEEYNTTTDTWIYKSSLPTGARRFCGAASVNEKVYVIGGVYYNNILSNVDIYDPATDTWSTGSPLPTPRCGLATVAVGDKIYAIGGRSTEHGGGQDAYNIVEIYNTTTDSWTLGTPLPIATSYIASAYNDNKIFILGGYSAQSDPDPCSTVQVYHIDADIWTFETNMTLPRASHASATYNNKIYSIGGTNGESDNVTVHKLVEEYHPSYENGSIVNHTYLDPGFYKVTLIVTDNEGLSNSTTKRINVTIDTIKPVITNVSVHPAYQNIGGHVNISCDVSDNVEIFSVKINITHPDNITTNITMNEGSYYYNTTFADVGTYTFFIWANDTSGNTNISPIYNFNITSQALLAISSSDITFSNNNPELGETIIMDAKIHNIGSETANNINVKFYDADSLIGEQNISYISPNIHKTATIQWTAQPEGIHPIKVVAAGNNTNIAESTRSIIVGQGFGRIDMTCFVTPSISYPGEMIKIQGTAIYNTTYGSGSPVAGADVTIYIQNQSGQWNGHTTRYGTFSIWITAPDTLGNYTVVIEVTDHTFSTTLQKTLQVIPNTGCEFPDLIISSLSISDDKPLINENISLTAQVKNIGNENATNVLVRFYDGTNIIGNVTIPQLNTNGKQQVTMNWTASPIGSHKINVVADPDDNITECNENNNDFWPPKTVYVYPILPDIIPVDITLSDNTPAVSQLITISAHIYNIGGSPVNDILVEFYDNSTSIGNDSISLPGKHGNGWVSIPYAFPSGGTHTITVCADPDNLTAEFNEENNCYFEYVDVHVENPDIVISSVWFSDSTPLEGEIITIFAAVENIGEINATNFSVSFSDDGDELDERFISFLGADMQTEVNITWVATPAGWHEIMVCGDSYDNISEFFENNNCGSRRIAVGLPCPDLQIFSTNISFSNMNPDVYENITVSATIRNVDVDPAVNVNVTFLFDEVIHDVLFIPEIEGTDMIICNVSHAFTGIGSHVVRVKAYPGPGDPPDENPDDNEASRAILVGTAPDLTISPTDIVFSKSSPIEGEIVWVNATVHNIGNLNAYQVSIGLFDGDPSLGGDLIGTNQVNILAGENETTSMQWTAHDPGVHCIHVMADPDDQIVEFNEENNEAWKNITVISDDVPPEIVDMSSNVAYTGSAFSFTADVTDNIVVSSAFVEYWYGSGSHTNVSMNQVIGETWEKTIVIDHTLETLHYVISACDFADNWNNTGVNDVTVVDDVPPSIGFVRASPSVQIVDYRVNISALVTDNIGVHTVRVNISGPPDFAPVNVSMNASINNTFYCENNYSVIGIYNYSIVVNDTSGNNLSSMVRQFEVVSGFNVTGLSQGWNFVSLPFNNSIEVVNTFILFNGGIINWSQAYSYDNPFNITVVSEYVFGWNRPGQYYTFSDVLNPGEGYWLYSYEDCELWIESFIPVYDEYVTGLESGWNLMGVPYIENVNKVDILVDDTDWNTAVGNGWISDFVFGWSRTEQSYIFADAFEPSYCYWLYAYQPCTLKRGGSV